MKINFRNLMIPSTRRHRQPSFFNRNIPSRIIVVEDRTVKGTVMKTGLKLIGYFTNNPANFRDDIPEECPLCGRSRGGGGIMVVAVDEDRNEFDVHLECWLKYAA